MDLPLFSHPSWPFAKCRGVCHPISPITGLFSLVWNLRQDQSEGRRRGHYLCHRKDGRGGSILQFSETVSFPGPWPQKFHVQVLTHFPHKAIFDFNVVYLFKSNKQLLCETRHQHITNFCHMFTLLGRHLQVTYWHLYAMYVCMYTHTHSNHLLIHKIIH